MSEELYRSAIQALQEHMAVLDGDGKIIATNRAWDIFAERNGAANDPSVKVGANYLDVCRRSMRDHDPCAMEALSGIEAVISARSPRFTMKYPCHSARERRWFSMTVVPMNSRENGAVVTHLNITEQYEAEMALRKSEQRLRQAIRAAKAASWSANVKSGEAEAEKLARDLLGLPEQPHLSLTSLISSVYHADRARAEAALRQTIDTGQPGHVELRIAEPDGLIRWLAFHVERHDTDSCEFLVGLVQDISPQKQREDQVRILMREVNHRSRNILSLVQSVARQTAKGNPEEFLERFDERILSLARAQELLLEHEWKAVPIRDLIIAELSPFSELLDNRIEIEGKAITINAEATKVIGMAIHELATNAAKYGALSSDMGHVAIAWYFETSAKGENFVLEWLETRGPEVVPPSRLGFGTFVTSKMIEASLGGSVSSSYLPDGLNWRFICPAANVMEKH